MTARPRDGFDTAIASFVKEMRLKFHARHEKQHKRGAKSVLDPGFTSADLDGPHIGEHFREEVAELIAADEEHRPGEAVDVANMAFLIWWKGRPR